MPASGPVIPVESNCRNISFEYPTKRMLLQDDTVVSEYYRDRPVQMLSTNRSSRFSPPEVSEPILTPIIGPVPHIENIEGNIATDSDDKNNGDDNVEDHLEDHTGAGKQWFTKNITQVSSEDISYEKGFEEKIKRRQHRLRYKNPLSVSGSHHDEMKATTNSSSSSTHSTVNARRGEPVNFDKRNFTQSNSSSNKWEPITSKTSKNFPESSWKPSQHLEDHTATGWSRRHKNLQGVILPYALKRPSGIKFIRLADFLPAAFAANRLSERKLRQLLPEELFRPGDAIVDQHRRYRDFLPTQLSRNYHNPDELWTKPSNLRTHKLYDRHQSYSTVPTAAQRAQDTAGLMPHGWSNLITSQSQSHARPAAVSTQLARPDLMLALENGLVNYQHDSINSQLPSAEMLEQQQQYQTSNELVTDAGQPFSPPQLLPAAQQQANADVHSGMNVDSSNAATAEQLLETAMKQLGSVQSLIDSNLAHSLEGAIKGLADLESKNNRSPIQPPLGQQRAAPSVAADQEPHHHHYQQEQQQQAASVHMNQKQIFDLMNLIAANQHQPAVTRGGSQQSVPQVGATMSPQNQPLGLSSVSSGLANPYSMPQQSYRPATGQHLSSPMTGFAPISQQQNQIHQQQPLQPNGYRHGEEQVQESPAEWYGPPPLPSGGRRMKNKSKRARGSPRRPQVKLQKRPRSSLAGQAMHEVDSPHDHQPSATFHKYKYPWYRPDDEDEEEGETELNIRFFNNFSRMGPLGGIARAGGAATVIMSLVFLIVSNFSLAATVIAHGIAGILRNLGQAAPDKVNKPSSREGKQIGGSSEIAAAHQRPEQRAIATTKQPTKLDDRIRVLGEKWR